MNKFDYVDVMPILNENKMRNNSSNSNNNNNESNQWKRQTYSHSPNAKYTLCYIYHKQNQNKKA